MGKFVEPFANNPSSPKFPSEEGARFRCCVAFLEKMFFFFFFRDLIPKMALPLRSFNIAYPASSQAELRISGEIVGTQLGAGKSLR